MDGGAWWAAVHGVANSQTQLSNFTFTFHFHALEKEMAIHSSALAWRIPGTGEPGGLPSMGSHSVGHDWSDLAANFSASYLPSLNPSISWQWYTSTRFPLRKRKKWEAHRSQWFIVVTKSFQAGMANTLNLSAKFSLGEALLPTMLQAFWLHNLKDSFFITFGMQQKLMREHSQLLEVHRFVIVWASQVVLVVKNQPVNAGDVRSSGGRKWQPPPVFLPAESYGQRGLVGLQSMGSQRVGHSWSDWACTQGYRTSIASRSEKSQAFVNLASGLFSNTTSSAVVDSLFASISTTCNKLDLKLSSRQKSEASAISFIFWPLCLASLSLSFIFVVIP